MVREPPAVLATSARVAAALAALAAFDLAAPHIGHHVGTVVEVLGLGLVSIPLATLVPRAMLRSVSLGVGMLAAAAVAVAATAGLILAGYPGTPATLTKLCAASLLGLALGSLLQSAAEIVGVALLIAAVDIYSVAAGPTRVIVEHHVDVLNAFTLALHPIGSAGVAQIGASDFVFLAVFLSAAHRFDLRAEASWLAMTASFGITLLLSYLFDRALPALPLLSLSFLLVNVAPLRARMRGRTGSPERE
ncbi:MAG: hypothetical protein QOI17_68 [Gaiellales bacterium]|nr:hypothetical protein [Gaiellales bacterium]